MQEMATVNVRSFYGCGERLDAGMKYCIDQIYGCKVGTAPISTPMALQQDGNRVCRAMLAEPVGEDLSPGIPAYSR